MAQRVTQSAVEVAVSSSNPRILVTQAAVETAYQTDLPAANAVQAFAVLFVEVNSATIQAQGTYNTGSYFPPGQLVPVSPEQVLTGAASLSVAPVFGTGALLGVQSLAGSVSVMLTPAFGAGSLAYSRELTGLSSVLIQQTFGSGLIEALAPPAEQQLEGSGFQLPLHFGSGILLYPRQQRGYPLVPLAVEWVHGQDVVSGWRIEGQRLSRPVYFPVLYFSGQVSQISFSIRSTAWRRGTNEILRGLTFMLMIDDAVVEREILETWPESGFGISLSLDGGKTWQLFSRQNRQIRSDIRLAVGSSANLIVRMSAPPGRTGVLKSDIRLGAVWISE